MPKLTALGLEPPLILEERYGSPLPLSRSFPRDGWSDR